MRKGFFFFETFWANNSSGGFEGPETFVKKKIFTISFHFLCHLLSSFSSCLFIFSFIFSLLFHPVSSLLKRHELRELSAWLQRGRVMTAGPCLGIENVKKEVTVA